MLVDVESRVGDRGNRKSYNAEVGSWTIILIWNDASTCLRLYRQIPRKVKGENNVVGGCDVAEEE